MRVLIVTRMWPTAERPHSGPHVHEQVKALRSAGISYDVLIPPGRGHLLPYLRLAVALNQRALSGEYDLIHAHYGFAGVAARFQRRLPVVVTFHGNDMIPRTDEAGRPTMFGRGEFALSRALSRLADRVIVVSAAMAQSIPEVPAVVIPLGVDLEKFQPMDQVAARRSLGLAADRRYVLFAGDPALTVKRYPLAHAAVRALRSDLPEAELLTVTDRPHDEMPFWLNAADALLLTSISEGSPVIVREALACNLPVVTVPVGDVPERLRGVTPSEVAPPHTDALAAAIMTVLHSCTRSNGREVVRPLSTTALARQHLELYRGLLSEQ